MPELHNFLKQHPDKKEKFEAMLDLALGASKYKLFIKRKLQNLAEAGNTAAPSISKLPDGAPETRQSDNLHRGNWRGQAGGLWLRGRTCPNSSGEQLISPVSFVATASHSSASHPSRRRR